MYYFQKEPHTLIRYRYARLKKGPIAPRTTTSGSRASTLRQSDSLYCRTRCCSRCSEKKTVVFSLDQYPEETSWTMFALDRSATLASNRYAQEDVQKTVSTQVSLDEGKGGASKTTTATASCRPGTMPCMQARHRVHPCTNQSLTCERRLGETMQTTTCARAHYQSGQSFCHPTLQVAKGSRQ